mmetsp:Transcript_50595/g.146804  ORF Transcript_50595/g.146804 Transcript_50595/m.146804 type:complete len:204 (+) Transcript_50595:505-1116(+)
MRGLAVWKTVPGGRLRWLPDPTPRGIGVRRPGAPLHFPQPRSLPSGVREVVVQVPLGEPDGDPLQRVLVGHGRLLLLVRQAQLRGLRLREPHAPRGADLRGVPGPARRGPARAGLPPGPPLLPQGRGRRPAPRGHERRAAPRLGARALLGGPGAAAGLRPPRRAQHLLALLQRPGRVLPAPLRPERQPLPPAPRCEALVALCT